ncbi:hypothetical protein [Thioflexithrix psekupsensis]|uniref:Uncharacterized protein n=1 Tax=Thioflexithrix psekupsensis TaxID=1570016 RepID=A0A251X7G6_9GAMM|nr:hypothetical protein [Thioflexithrix psekupsensis]OUD13885.1 hypothetical protein TPSD3_05940 [Thioflexithrix psekupsensis]
MKNIYLEVDEQAYETILAFIKLLPPQRCRVIEEENDDLTEEEITHINNCRAEIAQGDYSQFDEWEMVK